MKETGETASAQDSDQVVQWLTFVVDQEIFGIDVLRVKEVLRYSDIAEVPGSPHHVLGIINLRGKVITIHDLRMMLDVSMSEINDQTRIIVIELNDHLQGLLVDGVTEIINLRNSELEYTVNKDDKAPYIMGTSQKNNKLYILLSARGLLEFYEDDFVG